MPLQDGSRLGPYELKALLGAGGMGEVYRARDTRLDREVALKLVLEPFLADRERAQRFEREARTLAALNHPNIATLHGVEEADGRQFLVMELVEGESLAERIARSNGGLPVDESLLVARQIAEALEAAHEKGIVHRDLKPANVQVTRDGVVKVLDFGLARVVESPGSTSATLAQSPTMSGMATQAGVILGTASYMSPEQARGYPADHRSDVFSFGVVLYEMLTGSQPFPGETVSDVLASILAREPDLAALPADLSPRLAELIARCLHKHPKRRWQAIGDVRYELESLLANPRAAPEVSPPAAPVVVSVPWWRRAAPIGATAFATALLVGVPLWLARPSPPPAPVTRFALNLAPGQTLTAFTRGSLALSPQGDRLAYVANRQIFVHSMSEMEPRRIFDNESRAAVTNLAFSPDGESLAFWTDGAIRRIPRQGGSPLPLLALDSTPRGISWRGDSLLISQGSSILRLPAAAGAPETLIQLPDGEAAARPQWLPGGGAVLYTLSNSDTAQGWEAGKAVVQRPGESDRTVVVDPAADAQYVESGHILYVQRGVLFAVPFDVSAHRVTGAAVAVLEGVRRGTLVLGAGAAHLAVAPNGTLAYLPGPVAPSFVPQLVVATFDRSGGEQTFKIPAGPYSEPRMSPDGRYISFVTDEERETSVWVYDIKAGGSPRRLTFGGRDRHPVWTPDSRRVTFQSDREEDRAVYWQTADGSGPAERLTRPEKDHDHVPLSWSPDGDVLLVDDAQGERVALITWDRRSKKTAPFGGVESRTPTGAVFSPDGGWIAYSVRKSAATASNLVFVQPYPATGALFQVSKTTEDGHHQIWSPDGRELYYTPGPGAVLIAVPITVKPSFTLGEPLTLARPFTNDSPSAPRTYDVTPQGRLLGLSGANRIDSSVGLAQIHVVLNWFEELKAKVPTPR